MTAGQEITKELQDLANKDPAFRKGAGGHQRGKKGNMGAGARRGKHGVGGVGLGFGAPAGGSGGGMAGFARAASPEMPNGVAPAAGGPEAPSGFERAHSREAFTLDQSAPAAAAAAAAPGRDFSAGAPPAAAQAPVPAAAGRWSGAPEPTAAPQQEPPQRSTGGALRSMYASGMFGKSFVSSGTTGGDQAVKATIVAPKQQGRAMPPPPVPLSVQPAYTATVYTQGAQQVRKLFVDIGVRGAD